MSVLPEANRNVAYPLRFSDGARAAVYDAIFARRDVRAEFLSEPIPDELLLRLLDAAHHAGSVGFMQPWNFYVVRDAGLRRRVFDVFEEENRRASERFSGERGDLYRRLKLQGILETPINLCVTCDRERHGPVQIGRNTMRETDLYSTCCAIQNFWLAARVEGIGVGWVSILDPARVLEILSIPVEQQVVAYLCVGWVRSFAAEPDLQRAGWLPRLPLEQVVFECAAGAKPRQGLLTTSPEMQDRS